ncbi:Pentatricopeptide repeat-containing protein, mitochondrial [Vitis vinifera]|uniref:Pentatricopeptide repeat-containing protein, mitochondrial n=1 Tax=Vitis vinifera TaxID=29760 RepID=A0A438K3N5_VITVI|nr:Pentatricopeptide repeat-containing protein, mitochondrial [Vitis vinifera]
MYFKLGYDEDAQRLFDEMPNRDLVSWNSLMSGLSGRGYLGACLNAFCRMRTESGRQPNEVTLLSVVSACADMGALDEGKSLHGVVVKLGMSGKAKVVNSLINMYGKLGFLDAASQLFEEMPVRSLVSWNSMVVIHNHNGYAEKGMDLFNLMKRAGINPDQATMVALLRACTDTGLGRQAESIHAYIHRCGFNADIIIATALLNFHSGLVEEGKKYFEIMSEVYRVEPRLDHYSCMVDLLGRSGRLEDAYELIKSMPMEPSSGVWGCSSLVLVGYMVMLNLVREVAEQLLSLDPSDHRNYIMLSNIYSAAGLWRDASKIHRFVVGDQLHPRSDEIHTKLEELIRKIREAGCAPKTEFVLHDIDEEVKVDMINKHTLQSLHHCLRSVPSLFVIQSGFTILLMDYVHVGIIGDPQLFTLICVKYSASSGKKTSGKIPWGLTTDHSVHGNERWQIK